MYSIIKNSDLVRTKLLNIQSAMTLGPFLPNQTPDEKGQNLEIPTKLPLFGHQAPTLIHENELVTSGSHTKVDTPASKREVTSPFVLKKFKLQVPVPIFNHSLALRPILKAAESRIDKLEPIQSSWATKVQSPASQIIVA